MATALATQLTQIRAQSTNALDLKKQRKLHSQSLLFNPEVAATQDFDSIYYLCFEAFEDLCHLDTRFTHFANSLFSEQSKQEDRTQMTAAQNQYLDSALENFLHLVGGKLLLRPALKAVEWLVRRYRVHENNTQCLVLSFLPYHTAPVFSTLLSILPPQIPQTLKFLHPYAQPLINPPRRAVVYAASSNRTFFTALNSYTLKCCRSSYQHPTLISFWSSVATEAIALMLDHARSAGRKSQNIKLEDVLLYILPVLNDALALENVPELKVGCYMIVTVLASKADLEDEVLIALMEAVTSNWAQTSHAGLICLSVLAQQRVNPILPMSVFEALTALTALNDDLITLQRRYNVGHLTLGVVLGIINDLNGARDASQLRLLRVLIEAGLMDKTSTIQAIEAVLSAFQTLIPTTGTLFDVQGSLKDLLLRLADSRAVGPYVEKIMLTSKLDKAVLEGRLQGKNSSGSEHIGSDDTAMVENILTGADFESLICHIPTQTAYEISFLSHSVSFVFGSLESAFLAISAKSTDVAHFSDLPVLRKSLAMTEPLFFSFFIRIWCGNGPVIARAAAIRTVSDCLREKELSSDVQTLVPYLVYGLGDESSKIRLATKDLVMTLFGLYVKVIEDGGRKVQLPILGHGDIYGQGGKTNEASWLSVNETHRFLAELLVPDLEECSCDQAHVYKLVSDSLNGSRISKSSNVIQRGLKTSLRLAIFTFLCSHVVNTPLHRVKNRLLQMTNRVAKVGSISRTKLLFPLLSWCTSKSQEDLELACQHNNINLTDYLDQVAAIIVLTDRDGIQKMMNIIESGLFWSSGPFRVAVLRRLQVTWPSLKDDSQCSFARILFEQAMAASGEELDGTPGTDLIDTLRSLPLTSSTLHSLVESLPSMSSSLIGEAPAAKRRRTKHVDRGDGDVLSPKEISYNLQRITLVLELLEDSNSAKHPELLKGLFLIMIDLQGLINHHNAKLGYLQILVMDCMLTIVRRIEGSSDLRIDRSIIRADALIDCISTTDSPEVRNTALLLVSALATIVPDLILHSVMPIFTFMGATVLHHDDDFTAYVIKQTMESIVPRLVQSLHKRKEGAFSGVSELLLNFAAAFEHISSHRRLDLFASLIDKVGSRKYLFALFVILTDKFPGNRSVVQFEVELARQYDVDIRLETIQNYLQTIIDAQRTESTQCSVLLTNKTGHTMDTIVANLFLPALAILSDPNLSSKMSKILRGGGDLVDVARALYSQILQQVFLLSEQCQSNTRLEILCMQLLEASLGLLPLSDLVETLQQLLNHTEENIRRHVLRSLEHRFSGSTGDQEASHTACLAILPQLTQIVEETTDGLLKHTAIACVDRIIKKFGKKDVESVVDVAFVMASEKCLGATEGSLKTVSLLCLATILEVIGEGFIAVVPKAFPIAISHLQISIGETTEDSNLHNAVYSFIGALLMYIPWAVTGADLDRLMNVSYGSANAEMGEESDQSRAKVLKLIAKKVEADECFSALDRTWTSAIPEGPLAVKEYLDVFRLAIDRQPKSIIAHRSEMLCGLLLHVWDLRQIQECHRVDDSYDLGEIGELEDAVNDCAIAIVYKLNDATFQPLFLRMLDWATDPSAKSYGPLLFRQITLFTFLLEFFDSLKSIVTSYAGFIFEDSVRILNTTSPADKNSMELWRRVILTLHKTFEHDQDGYFQSPAHFDSVSTVLLEQLGYAGRLPVLAELIPAIAELAVATESAAHYKKMNMKILKYLRSHNPEVRLAALQCEIALTRKLGEEWLALLPEMLPFISESREDDDEKVEKATQSWVNCIEEIMGESLNPMLQ